MNKKVVNIGKIFVVIVSIIVIVRSFDQPMLFNEKIYFDSLNSFKSDDTISLYGIRDNNYQSSLKISKLNGEIISEFDIDFSNEIPNSIDPKKGFPKKELIQLKLDEYQPGVYIVNDNSYFVVRGEEKTDLTIVVPALSNACIDTSGGYSLLTENEKSNCAKINIIKPINVDKYTLNLTYLLSIIPKNLTINFCTDLDFNSEKNIPKSKAYLFYGNCMFATPAMLFNLDKKLLNESNFIFLSQYTFNNRVHFNSKNEILNTCSINDSIHKLIAYNKSDPVFNQTIFGANYTFGGHQQIKEFPSATENLPKDLNSNNKKLHIFSDYWIGPLDATKAEFWYKIPVEYHGNKNQGGIFTYKGKNSSGIIYHFGTNSWLEKDNLEIKENKTLLLHAIQEAIK